METGRAIARKVMNKAALHLVYAGRVVSAG
jgi:hypothetical protein